MYNKDALSNILGYNQNIFMLQSTIDYNSSMFILENVKIGSPNSYDIIYTGGKIYPKLIIEENLYNGIIKNLKKNPLISRYLDPNNQYIKAEIIITIPESKLLQSYIRTALIDHGDNNVIIIPKTLDKIINLYHSIKNEIEGKEFYSMSVKISIGDILARPFY